MDSPISALPQVGNPTANDFIPIVQNGVTSKMTVGQFQQNLPLSSAETAALALKAPLASPSFTGTMNSSGRTTLGVLGASGQYALTMYPDTAGQSVCNIKNTGSALVIGTGSNPYDVPSFVERMRMDTTTGWIGVGTSAPSQYTHGGSAKLIEVLNSDTAVNSQSHLILSSGATTANSAIGAVTFTMPSVSNATTKMMAYMASQSAPGHTSASPASILLFATRNGNNLVEAARFDESSNLLVGVTSGSWHRFAKNVNEGSPLLEVVSTFTGYRSGFFYTVATEGFNGALSGLNVGKNVSTGRSINAGGTINASGADYAEYMPKADTCGIVEKGAVIGIDATGKLIDKWADALSFAVKSTDPSYVGGDVWGSEEALGAKRPAEPAFEAPAYTGCQPPLEGAPAEDATDEEKAAYVTAMAQYEADHQVYEDAVTAARQQFDTITIPAYESSLASFEALLEAARQKVDRIAFCGQVPVNVLGATPGQYIIPVQDGAGIKGIAVSNPPFEQYMIAVGKVIAIEADGRARIIVKPV